MTNLLPRALAIAGALFLGCHTSISLGAEKAAKPVKIKLDTLKPGKVQVDPRLGYILLRLGPISSPKDKPIPVGFARVDEKTNTWIQFDKVEDIPPEFWRTGGVAVNPGRSFGNLNGSSVYIVGAYPGRWTINGVGSTCLSMGTYAFDVKQGEISDIGTLLTGREDGKSAAPELKDKKLSQDLVDFGVAMNIVMTETLYVKPAGDQPTLPKELAAMPVKKVALIPDVRNSNNCSTLINRAASLPPVGHQPPMTKEQAMEAFAKINPSALSDSVKKNAEKAAQAAK